MTIHITGTMFLFLTFGFAALAGLWVVTWSAMLLIHRRMSYPFPVNLLPLFIRLLQGKGAEDKWKAGFERVYPWQGIASSGLYSGGLLILLGFYMMVKIILSG